ncbi:MAG TPA: M48 family metalloprotease [Nitrospirota bacterium]|nr:M48 family metalloprotease [Nitrospirota bacterium]
MIKPAVTMTVVLLMLSVLCPSSIPAAQPEENWRDRISTEAGVVATSDIVEEIRFGRAVAARIIGRYGLYENTQIMIYINLVGQTIARGANRPEIEFHFAVLNGDEIMAFGIPGGYIFITKGALRAMRDEAELAGILAREVGHIAEKTAVRELKIRGIEDAGITGLAQIIGGSTDPARAAFRKAVDKAMDMLFRKGYKREEDEKADEDAVILCAMAGYDPSGLVRYMGRTHGVAGKQTGAIDGAQTSIEVRIDRLKAFILQEGADAGDFKTYEKRFIKYMSAVR